jgi:hypothetical protein
MGREAMTACRICDKPFEPRMPLQAVCGLICARKVPQIARKAAKAQDKARREAIKPRSKWLAEAQQVVNRYVRLRDMLAGKGCITCGAHPEQKRGGTSDAGHFRSVGSAPHLRFYTPQIALQCTVCNRYQGGRQLDFRRALVERNGAEWVERIEAMQGVAKFDIDYLRRLKRVIGKRVKRMEAKA